MSIFKCRYEIQSFPSPSSVALQRQPTPQKQKIKKQCSVFYIWIYESGIGGRKKDRLARDLNPGG